MMSVTTYASQLQTLNNIKRNQSAANELSNQVATQVKSGDLSYYGGLDAGRILNSRQQVSRLEAYNKGIDIVTPELKSYDLQVSRMDELASSVSKALQGQGTYDPEDESEIGTLIDTALTELTSLLNEKVGGRYLWSGGNYDAAPVGDLTGLPDLTAADPFAAATSPTLPDYYLAAPGSDDVAWHEASFSPEAGKTVTYGQVAADPAIQRLVYSLQMAKSAFAASAAAPDDATAKATWTTFRTQALSELDSARDGLKSLGTEISIDLSSVTDSAKANDTMINIFKDEEGGIVDIDTAEAGVKLTQIQNQLQATYSIVASLADTSLVKFL
ncbi:flagellin [Zavarzinia sp.]|uniref:flagellin n=1 Tax=Zavarzinia sp. TaxID=2027920 RepID=UPI003BB5C6CC